MALALGPWAARRGVRSERSASLDCGASELRPRDSAILQDIRIDENAMAGEHIVTIAGHAMIWHV